MTNKVGDEKYASKQLNILFEQKEKSLKISSEKMFIQVQTKTDMLQEKKIQNRSQDRQKQMKLQILPKNNPIKRFISEMFPLSFSKLKNKTENIPSSLTFENNENIPEQISEKALVGEQQVQQNRLLYQKPIWLRVKSLMSKYKKLIYLIITIIGMIQIGLAFRFYTTNAYCGYDTDSKCFKYTLIPLSKKVILLLTILIIDSIFQLFIVIAFINKLTYRVATFLGLIQIIILSYTAGFQLNIRNAIGIIQLAHIVIIVFLILLLGFITFLRFLCKKSKTVTIITTIILVIFLYSKDCCSNWKYGINGEIQDEKNSCQMQLPTCFMIRLMSNIDLNIVFHNCFIGEHYKYKYDQAFSKDVKNGSIIGFSNLKGVKQSLITRPHIMQTVVDHAKRYKTIKQAKQANESEVIFDTNAQQYHIEVIYNQTLALQRQQKWENNQNSSSPSLAKNVLFLFLDAVSRYETKLALPKFVKWFQKHSKYHSYKDEPQKIIQQQKIQRQAYQFYKYHSLGYYTIQNVYAMFYGKRLNQMLNYKVSNISKDFRFESWHKDFMQRGYVVGYSSTYIAASTADIYLDTVKRITLASRDHSCPSFNQDPNFFQRYNLQFGFSKGLSASTDRCLYDKKLSEYSFQYATSFFEKYRDNAKMFEINLVQGHDYIGGSIKHLDDSITSFLQGMQAKGYLNDTIVVATSDHGGHRAQAFQGITSDHFHPFMYVAIPQKMNKKYRDKIRFNQKNLVTAFNIYHFMNNIAQGEEYQKKDQGLLGNLSFQTNCDKANIIYDQDSVCYCRYNNSG